MCDEADRLAAGAGAAVRTRIGINRYWACDIDADTVVTWSLIERLGSLAAQSGEKMLALQVLKCRLHTTLEGGDLEAADDVAARFAASAAEVGSADMLRLDRLYAAMRAARGEYHLASELAVESSRLLAETGRALHAQVVDGLVRLPWQTMVGDHRAAEMTIDVLRMFSERGSLWVIFDAWFHAVSGNLDAATAAADEFDLESFLGEERQQNHWILASTAVLVAQFTGRTQWAAPLAAWFGEQPEASVHFGQTMFLGFGWHYLGIAESMLEGAEHKEAAVQALATAANRSARVDATPWRLLPRWNSPDSEWGPMGGATPTRPPSPPRPRTADSPCWPRAPARWPERSLGPYSCLVLPFCFCACFHWRTSVSSAALPTSAADRGAPSANTPAASRQPSGRMPRRLASRATKILAFSSPYPGRARRRRYNSEPSAAVVQTADATPSYSSTSISATACARLPIDLG